VDYLVVAVVAGLAAVERKGFLQAMLSRPVALAPIVGLALGDLRGGLLLGPPLELLWLGAVNMGASLPPNEALGTAAIAAAAVLSGQALGTGVTPAVTATVPSASLGGSEAPMFTAPSQSSSSGAPMSSPPDGSPSASPVMGASAIGRASIACRKPFRSTAARPATKATTR